MERLLVKGTSKEDIQLIANFAARLGLKVEFLADEITYVINEPNTLEEWDTLTKSQQNGIVSAINNVKTNGGIPHGEVMKAMRKKYE